MIGLAPSRYKQCMICLAPIRFKQCMIGLAPSRRFKHLVLYAVYEFST